MKLLSMCVTTLIFNVCEASLLEEDEEYLCALSPQKTLQEDIWKELHQDGEKRLQGFWRSSGILCEKCMAALKYQTTALQQFVP